MKILAEKKKGFTLPNPLGRDLRGFTLIELLIVIAIIGILASLILISLSGSRTRAKDARIASDLKQVINVGEMIFSSDQSYASVANDADIGTLISDMTGQGGANANRYANTAGYCVEVKFGNTRWGCVNSNLTVTFNCANTNGTACAGTANNAPTNTYCTCLP